MSQRRYFNRGAGRPLPDAEQGRKLDAAMYRAIADNDLRALESALEAGAHPDADDSRPLRLCATADKYLLAKALMLAGADIGHAILQAERENAAIPRRTESGLILTFHTPLTAEGKKRETALREEIAVLEKFRQDFLDSTLPMTQLNLLYEIRMAQHELSRRMDAMERALRDIDAPKPIDKKPAARAQDKGNPPPGSLRPPKGPFQR